MKKDVLLITNYWHFEEEKASSRYRSMANVLSEQYDLEVITSRFYHQTKAHRKDEELNLDSLPYKMTLIYEKGYPKNICLKRISSYTQFGKNVLKYLKNRKKADLIIVSVPSLAVADYVTKYANKNKIPVIVDIQDLWPEAFKMAINLPVVSDLLFYPMKKQAERIYRRADEIMAVSDTYVDIGKRYNLNCEGLSIYIGADSELIKKRTEGITVEKPEDEFWIGYCGALGHSYDIKSCISAIKQLQDSGITNVVFKIMGDGVLRSEFEDFAAQHGVKCDFMGFIEYGKMMRVLESCDVAVNPIVGKSVSTIINKISDYAAAGVPVVNSQNSQEYRSLLEHYRAGINVENGNDTAMKEALLKLYNSKELRDDMRSNSYRLFEDKFDRQKTYISINSKIDLMLK